MVVADVVDVVGCMVVVVEVKVEVDVGVRVVVLVPVTQWNYNVVYLRGLSTVQLCVVIEQVPCLMQLSQLQNFNMITFRRAVFI